MRYCKNCGYSAKFQTGEDACALTKQPIAPTKDYCSKFIDKTSLSYCDNCHNVIFPHQESYIELVNDHYILLCPRCYR